MKVLSLFDGMACGRIAFEEMGIPIERYVAYEYDEDTANEQKGRPCGYAALTASYNFPNIEQRGNVFGADFTEYKGFDAVIGGSPCTYWSIAQKNNRETEASGLGWELFQQYARAVKEVKPRFFLYENNKSMSKAIRASITETFGFEPILMNSALVSAQNRQRLYWVGIRQEGGTYRKCDIEQPEDRGILLRDVLDGYAVGDSKGKAYVLTAGYSNGSGPNIGNYAAHTLTKKCKTMVAEPVCMRYERTEEAKQCRKAYEAGEMHHGFNELNELHPRQDGKTNTLSTVLKDNQICEPLEYIPYNELKSGKNGLYCVSKDGTTAMGYTVNYIYGKSPTVISGQASKMKIIEPLELDDEYFKGGFGSEEKPNLMGKIVCNNTSRNGKQPSQVQRIYSVNGKAICLDADARKYVMCASDGKQQPVYEVLNGQITIKDKQYPIKLADGYYIIRKLTVNECKRLQTVPEWYEFPVSNTQAYKMLGNGWTVDVIAHLLKGIAVQAIQPTQESVTA